jgi:GNAT superfamily N-acetyltransferase
MTTMVARYSPLVEFESLAQGDIEALAPALKEAKMTISYPHLAEPIVAKVNGEIVGFAFAQLLPHCEPLHVLPEWRGQGIAEELARRVVALIEATGAGRFCCVASNRFVEDLCLKMGMIPVPGVLYVKEP